MDIERVNMSLEKLLGRTILSSFYKSIVKRMEIADSDTVLDFGCGTGNTARHIVRKAKRMICLDINSEKIKHAKRALKKYDNVEFVNKELNGCTYNQHFDKIVVVFVLHDFNASLLSETAELFYHSLKTNGKVHVYEPCKETHGIDPELVKKQFIAAGFNLLQEHSEKNKFRMIFEK